MHADTLGSTHGTVSRLPDNEILFDKAAALVAGSLRVLIAWADTTLLFGAFYTALVVFDLLGLAFGV